MNVSDNIEKLIAQKEGRCIEFKSAKGGIPSSLWETYSAFANSQGGTMLLGVSEDKRGGKAKLDYLTSEQLAKYQQDLWNQLNNPQKVNKNILQDDDITLDEVHGIIRIDVPKASAYDRPIYTGQNPFTGTYKRNNEGDYRCSEEEVRSMFASSSNYRGGYDKQILIGSSIDQDIDRDSLARYRQVFLTRKPNDSRQTLSDHEFLVRIGAYATDRQNKQSGLTVAGLLMLGKWASIAEFLPCYFVDFQERLGETPDTRWTNRIYADGSWEANLFLFFNRVLPELYKRIPVPFALRNGVRVDESGAHAAIREAFVNTLIHADYTVGGGIVITSDQRALCLRNLGDLLITQEQYFKGGVSQPRNPSLMHMFQLVGYAERAGSGGPNILGGWEGAKYSSPHLEEGFSPNSVSLILSLRQIIPEETKEALVSRFGARRIDCLNSDELIILCHALAQGFVCNQSVRREVDLHATEVTRLLIGLRNKGYLLSQGQGRGTTYFLPQSNTPLSEQVGRVVETSQTVDIEEDVIHSASNTTQSNTPLSEQVEPVVKLSEVNALILDFCIQPQSLKEILLRLKTKSRGRVLIKLIRPLVQRGLLGMLYPDKPNHKGQKYYTIVDKL